MPREGGWKAMSEQRNRSGVTIEREGHRLIIIIAGRHTLTFFILVLFFLIFISLSFIFKKNKIGVRIIRFSSENIFFIYISHVIILNILTPYLKFENASLLYGFTLIYLIFIFCTVYGYRKIRGV